MWYLRHAEHHAKSRTSLFGLDQETLFFDYLNLLCGHPLSSGYGVVNGSVQHQISWLVASRLGLVGVRWIWWKRKYKKRFTLRRKLSGKHHQPTDQEAKWSAFLEPLQECSLVSRSSRSSGFQRRPKWLLVSFIFFSSNAFAFAPGMHAKIKLLNEECLLMNFFCLFQAIPTS